MGVIQQEMKGELKPSVRGNWVRGEGGGDRKDALTTVYYSTGHSAKLGLSSAVLLE